MGAALRHRPIAERKLRPITLVFSANEPGNASVAMLNNLSATPFF